MRDPAVLAIALASTFWRTTRRPFTTLRLIRWFLQHARGILMVSLRCARPGAHHQHCTRRQGSCAVAQADQ